MYIYIHHAFINIPNREGWSDSHQCFGLSEHIVHQNLMVEDVILPLPTCHKLGGVQYSPIFWQSYPVQVIQWCIPLLDGKTM
jgi:hypothetical protein